MTSEQIHALATRIADDLFTDGFGMKAVRLDMHSATIAVNERSYLGGWSKDAAIERITAVLTKEANEQQ